MSAQIRRPLVIVVALACLAMAGSVIAAMAMPGGNASARALDVSGSFEGDGYTFDYTVTGVEPDENDAPFRHSGKVVSNQVTLSGTITYTIEEGFVTNLGMSASLSVLDQAASDSWPPEGVDGRVGGTTITFPFALSVEIPPPPPADATAPPFGAETEEDDEPQPYATLSFSVNGTNCNDYGVCGGPSAQGSFLVFALPTPSPTVDWTATAGALGAAAAVAAAAGIIGGRKDGDEDGDDADERWRYVLQVASNEVAVDVAAGGRLDVEVWAVDAKGIATAAAAAAVTATVTGPFTAAVTASQGALHTTVTTSGPPGSTGSVRIDAVAGPVQMSTTVALRAEGQYRLECVPAGDPVLRPDPATGRYRGVDIDVRLTSGGAPVSCTLTAAEVLPAGLVSLTQLATPGSTTDVRLHCELAADPGSLVDPANQVAELKVWAQPADVAGAEALTAATTIRLQPPSAVIHWMRSGHPATLDRTIELEAEEGAELDLEVWLESTDGSSPPPAEFSHMVNEDLAGRQLAPTIADFSCHPQSRPWQKAALDNRAHSRWRVNRALPSSDRPDLVPPVDTAIRVRAWPAGSVTRETESITASEKRLAQCLVPVRLGPVRLVAELVEPTDPIPADGLEYPVTIQVLRERDRTPYVGAIDLAIAAVPGRTVSTLAATRHAVAAGDEGRIVVALTTPELTYRRDTDYSETIQVSLPAGTGPGPVMAALGVELAPAISVLLGRTKKGLVWDDLPGPIERPASDRVSAIAGRVGVAAKQSRPPERELDVVVNVANVAGAVPPGTLDEPVAKAPTDDTGRFELHLPGLTPTPGVGPVELDLDELPRGALAPDVATRLDRYENLVLPRVGRSRRPLGVLVGAAHADTLAEWRFETLRKLASETEEKFEDILAAIEIAEADAVYTDAFARTYYDLAAQAVDSLGSLLGDVMSFAFTKLEVGKLLADWVVNPLGKGVIGLADDYLVRPGISALRSVARRLVGLVDDLLRLIDVPSVELRESARAIRELWETISTAADLGQIVEAAVDLLVNAVLYIARAIHALVLKTIRHLLPLTQSILNSLAPALGPHLDPGWNKLCEDTLKQLIDELGVLPAAAGGIGDEFRRRLDPFPGFATRATGSVLGDLGALRVPADPGARRDMIKDMFDTVNTQAFDHRQTFATADECLAWFNLAATALQLILIGKAAAKGLLKVVGELAGEAIGGPLKKVADQLDAIDIFVSVVNGAVHATEMTTSLVMGYAIATHGTGAVKALT